MVICRASVLAGGLTRHGVPNRTTMHRFADTTMPRSAEPASRRSRRAVPMACFAVCLSLLAGCRDAPPLGEPPPAETPPLATSRPAEISFRAVDGSEHRPFAVPADTVHVVVFTSPECPIANAYAPTFGELAAAWVDLPVRLFLVHVDPDLTAAEAQQHAAEYRLPGTILLDPRQDLAHAAGASTTPEAVVLAAGGTVRYRGRIDDQWRQLGTRAPAASSHDLGDAVRAVLAGREVSKPWPPAVGCRLPEPAVAPNSGR
jgi:thiol-disulfide isomerase/thioredoxin